MRILLRRRARWALLIACFAASGCDGASGDPDSGVGPRSDAGASQDASTSADASPVVDGGAGSDGGASDGGTAPSGPSLPPACPDTGVEHTTADLGWTEGQEVRDALRALLETVDPGDTIVLSHLYQLSSGGVEVPDGVHFSAAPGAGFQLVGIADASGPYIDLSSCTRWHNLSIVDDQPRGTEEFVRTNNKTAVRARGENLLFDQCLFDANTKTQLELRDVSNARIHSTHFDNGYFTLLIRPQTQDVEITDSLFSNSFGDGIKTVGSGASDVRRMVVRRTVFEDNLRDGIDTTGGWRASRVESCIFRRNGVSGMDIKNVYNTGAALHPEGSPNSEMDVIDSEFIDNPNGIVLTTNDIAQALTEASDAAHLVRDLRVVRCIFERNEGSGRGFLIKDAHSISWDGVELLGDTTLHRIFGPDENRMFGGQLVRPPIPMTNYDIDGDGVTTGPARGSNDIMPFTAVGPR
ncbi:MAG: right-handed parallel beta-helix repeat-containing protein [Sandaracinaceae bacterium]